MIPPMAEKQKAGFRRCRPAFGQIWPCRSEVDQISTTRGGGTISEQRSVHWRVSWGLRRRERARASKRRGAHSQVQTMAMVNNTMKPEQMMSLVGKLQRELAAAKRQLGRQSFNGCAGVANPCPHLNGVAPWLLLEEPPGFCRVSIRGGARPRPGVRREDSESQPKVTAQLDAVPTKVRKPVVGHSPRPLRISLLADTRAGEVDSGPRHVFVSHVDTRCRPSCLLGARPSCGLHPTSAS